MRTFSWVLGLGIAAFAASDANAIIIGPANWGGCFNQTSCTIGDATLSSLPGTKQLNQKTVAGFQGLGLEGGGAGNEIDAGETLKIEFASSVVVRSLRILFLFDGPEFGDVRETAIITAGSPFSLVATGPTTATWSNPLSTVSNCSVSALGGAACWDISNPFGTGAQSVLLFGTNGLRNVDYSFGNLDYDLVGIPEPTTLAILGAGLLGLGLVARRKPSEV
jgi:hypothetical protein